MISMIPVKCPACGASISVEEDRKMIYCEYCGTQVILKDDSVTKHYEINEAEIRRIEADERIQNRKLEIEERKTKRKWIFLAIYAGICVLMGISTYVGYKLNYKDSFILLMVTIVLATIPLMILLTRMILQYGKPSVTSNTESIFFGLIKDTTYVESSPGKNVLILWLMYISIICTVCLIAML